MAIQRPPALPPGSRSMHLSIGEADGFVIMQIPGWPMLYIDVETTRGIVAQLAFAADLIDARAAGVPAPPKPIPKAGGPKRVKREKKWRGTVS